MLDYYSNHYEYKIIFGDFNMNPVKPEMNTFLNTENLTNVIKENTCFKGAGSCIDLILTNSEYSFQYSSSIEAGLSDHHHFNFIKKETLAQVLPCEFCEISKNSFFHRTHLVATSVN